ncbi:hypothetical protein NKG05_24540 [Oerskovia sp. M15]
MVMVRRLVAMLSVGTLAGAVVGLTVGLTDSAWVAWAMFLGALTGAVAALVAWGAGARLTGSSRARGRGRAGWRSPSGPGSGHRGPWQSSRRSGTSSSRGR